MDSASTQNHRSARPRRAVSAPKRGAERLRLDAEIAALRDTIVNDEEFRQAAIRVLAGALEEGRAEARRQLEDGGKGLACAARISHLEDEIIGAVHGLALRFLRLGESAPAAARLTVAAVGGYGRGLLAPGSDIDLLFLLPGERTPEAEKIVETMLYVLWDLRQKVGHATRSIDECLRQAKADMTIRTTLLEARFILGEPALFDNLWERFDKEIVARSAREFVAAKLAERDSRLKRTGASRYEVEPNLKEGKGGLRDLNTLFWVAKYAYRVRDTHELIGAGLFTAKEFSLFRRCEEFLWAVRCHLHFLTGRPEERLSFDFQRPIARRLGYAPRAGMSDAERFMKHYFLIAKDVGDLTAIVCAALEERHAKPRPVLDRFFRRLRRRSSVIADAKDFKIEFDRISVVRGDVFERDPTNLIRLFWVADRSNLAIHPDATRLVTHSLKRIDADLRNDPEANRIFLEILTSRRSPEIVLRHMNEAGVLGRFIPDFGRVVGMMQFNMYHHYTVDEHLLRTIGVLANIEAGRLIEDHPLASEFTPTIAHRRVLYVAAFLHDIAKGRREDHSLAGADVARRLCPRFGLSPAETEAVVWLVEQHLTMSIHRPEPGSLGPAHDGDLRRRRADRRAPQDAADIDGLRHPGGRPRRLERMERPAPAHAVLGNRGRARRRPFLDRPQVARRGGARGAAPGAAGLVRPGFRDLCGAPLPRLLAQGRPEAADRAGQAALLDGGRGPLAGDRGGDGRLSRRDRADHRRARSPPPPVDHRRRVRRRGRQYRRRADIHDDRRPRARHDLPVPRL